MLRSEFPITQPQSLTTIHPKSGPLKFLDGLRGIAALYVVLFHVAAEFWGYQASHVGPSRLMLVWQKIFGFGGHSCVTLFICLSGFSLAIPNAKNSYTTLSSKSELKEYAIRRFLRIGPPYYVAIALVLLFAVVVPSINTLSSTPWHQALPVLDTRSILFHVLLIHGFDPRTLYQLSPQLWSIGTEAQIYLWLPLVIVPIARRKPIALAVVAALAFSALTFLVPAIQGACLHYVFSFTLGAYAADQVFNPSPSKPKPQLLMLGLICTSAISLALFARTTASVYGFQDVMLSLPFALLLFLLARSEGKKTLADIPHFVLGSRFCQFMGKISYSLYLVHYVIIATVHSLCIRSSLSVTATVLALMVLAPLGSIMLATIMRLGIEEPFLRISARFRNSSPFPVA